uniref:Uncharacterized protein n=1 Tax=Faecalibaculum rodentium TaxID=1702221 RepID=A0A140DYW3_9FIRM|nr:hypothetical protein AALO17_27060 [Faecalibaculum rodentium]
MFHDSLCFPSAVYCIIVPFEKRKQLRNNKEWLIHANREVRS